MACKLEQNAARRGDDAFDDPMQERRLIIIGKTGNGKSSLGNILLGQPHFRVGFSMTSTTVSPASGYVDFRGWKIKVLDTPDISNMEGVDEDEAQRHVATWKSLTSPNAHAILLAVRCDVRYTREEHEIFLRLKKLWGSKSLSRRLIVAFTFGDRQDTDIREELKKVCPELKNVLKEASHRYVVFNNLDSSQGKAQQLLQLMHMVDKLDAKALRKEERRLLMGVQVCPQGPVPSPCCVRPPLPRSLSAGSTSSAGSISADIDCIRLVLVGKAGTGKSSTGNTILGRAGFPVTHSIRRSVHASHMEEVDIDGKRVQVVDTPGLQRGSDDQHYQQESSRASQIVSPGPHALLYVVRHQAVTVDDLNGFRFVKQALGQGLSHHTIVVLVGASQRSSTSTLPEEAGEEGDVFPVLLQEAGNKAWRVSNAEVEADSRKRQVDVLMHLVRSILNNSGGYCFHGDPEVPEKRDGDKAGKSSCGFL